MTPAGAKLQSSLKCAGIRLLATAAAAATPQRLGSHFGEHFLCVSMGQSRVPRRWRTPSGVWLCLGEGDKRPRDSVPNAVAALATVFGVLGPGSLSDKLMIDEPPRKPAPACDSSCLMIGTQLRPAVTVMLKREWSWAGSPDCQSVECHSESHRDALRQQPLRGLRPGGRSAACGESEKPEDSSRPGAASVRESESPWAA